MAQNSMNKDRPQNLPDDFLAYAPLAMAYVPMQTLRDLYTPQVALQRGTVFEELDLPFLGQGGMKK